MGALAPTEGGIAPALSDLRMVIRGRTGLRLDAADRLRDELPWLWVIRTSSHSREAREQTSTAAGAYHFFPSPCRPKTLLAALRALLDGENPRSRGAANS